MGRNKRILGTEDGGGPYFSKNGPSVGQQRGGSAPHSRPPGESLGLEISGPVPTRGSRQDADGDSLWNGFLTLSRSTLAGAARRRRVPGDGDRLTVPTCVCWLHAPAWIVSCGADEGIL